MSDPHPTSPLRPSPDGPDAGSSDHDDTGSTSPVPGSRALPADEARTVRRPDEDVTATVRVGPATAPSTGPATGPPGAPGATPTPVAPDLPRQELPRFELRRRIGAGNHGVVFRAHDRQLQRDVAIKRFSHFLADDPRAMRRITREVATLARVSHPNVVTVHDLVQLPDGDGEITPHLVMELVEGTSLRDLLATHGPSPRSVIAVRGVLEGLAACHRADILHLDIKPANVLVTSAGGVKIVDFGIARAASDATATVAGTPHYMAPEQYDGRADQRSDVYSVGCLLFECLTGRPPFEGTMATQLLAHRTQPRPDPRRTAPYVSAGLAGVVMRAMAIEPDQRYASVTQMLDVLSSVRIEPVVADHRDARATAVVPEARPHGTRQHPPAVRPAAAPPDRQPPPGPGPVVTRWSRLQRLTVGLGLSAFVVALVPGLVWTTTTIPPAPELVPAAMLDPTPWWLLAVAIAAVVLLVGRERFVERVGGPPVGWQRPVGTVDAGVRAGVRQAAGAAIRGSLPMLLPWYMLLVTALADTLGLGRPADPYGSGWTIAWLLMPLAAVLLTWHALTRARFRLGRLLLSLVLLGGAGLAGLLFVAYPSLTSF